MNNMKKITSILSIVAIALLSACTQIDTGNVGVESSMGQFKSEELQPGVYFTAFKKVIEISTKENVIELKDMKPKSQDNLTMADLDIDIYVRTNPASAADLLVKYAGDLSAPGADGAQVVGFNLVLRQAREAAYKVAATFPAAEMHTKRTEIASEVVKSLQAELDKDAGKGSLIVTNAIVRNIVTDPALEASIKDAGKTQFEIKQAQQKVELAKADAERKRVEAEGEARANQIIAASITPQLLRLREIETQAKFAGQGTHTVLLGGDAKPLVQVK